METTLSTLLIVSVAVMLTCVVISYSVSIVQDILNTKDLPAFDQIKAVEQAALNQTNDLLNQTGLLPSNQTGP